MLPAALSPASPHGTQQEKVTLAGYPHEHNVAAPSWTASCGWSPKIIRILEGLNLMDEFSDNICAYVEPFDGEMKLISVETVP